MSRRLIWWAFAVVVALGVAIPLLVRTPAIAIDVNGTFTDDDGNKHEPYIEAIAAAGITTGCTSTHYCPGDTVTRAQMASFLARTLELDPEAGGPFTDIGGSVHAGAINAIYEAGITTGCTPTRYCPSEAVRRDQMASFLARAFDLDPENDGPFTDVTGNLHEENINAIFEAGITTGCTATLYCPHKSLPRDEMATFLGRAKPLQPIYIQLPLFDLPTYSCSKDGTSCKGSTNLPERDTYLVQEGWYQVLPYQPGEQAEFTDSDTRFDLLVDGHLVPSTSLPLVNSGQMATREFRTLVIGLDPGQHTITGLWYWNGNLIRTTTLTASVSP
jgi:hypothetical protein